MQSSVLDFWINPHCFKRSNFILNLYAPFSGPCFHSRSLLTPRLLPTLPESSEFLGYTWNTQTKYEIGAAHKLKPTSKPHPAPVEWCSALFNILTYPWERGAPLSFTKRGYSRGQWSYSKRQLSMDTMHVGASGALEMVTETPSWNGVIFCSVYMWSAREGLENQPIRWSVLLPSGVLGRIMCECLKDMIKFPRAVMILSSFQIYECSLF